MENPPKMQCLTPEQIPQKKWRGIETKQERINEEKAVTITNYLGQKSMSLPRIDDQKRWAGFPGLAGTARKIARLIPGASTKSLYVEPFAGSAKVYQELIKWNSVWGPNSILNDTSKFVRDWLKENFKHAKITGMDFARCIKKYDSKKTVFLIDPPWVKSFYDQGFASFNRESVRAYDEELLKLCENIKGKFIITTRKENTVMRKSGFKHKTITSIYVVSGKYPKVLLTHNL